LFARRVGKKALLGQQSNPKSRLASRLAPLQLTSTAFRTRGQKSPALIAAFPQPALLFKGLADDMSHLASLEGERQTYERSHRQTDRVHNRQLEAAPWQTDRRGWGANTDFSSNKNTQQRFRDNYWKQKERKKLAVSIVMNMASQNIAHRRHVCHLYLVSFCVLHLETCSNALSLSAFIKTSERLVLQPLILVPCCLRNPSPVQGEHWGKRPPKNRFPRSWRRGHTGVYDPHRTIPRYVHTSSSSLPHQSSAPDAPGGSKYQRNTPAPIEVCGSLR